MSITFTAVYQRAAEGGFVALVPELPGANTQGETLAEARANLREAVELVLAAKREVAQAGIDERDVIRGPLTVGI